MISLGPVSDEIKTREAVFDREIKKAPLGLEKVMGNDCMNEIYLKGDRQFMREGVGQDLIARMEIASKDLSVSKKSKTTSCCSIM